MSLNFTGSTAKRRVNLGNRNTIGKNNSSFLKNVQDERKKREQIRKETKSIVAIQSAIRSFLVRREWNLAMAARWEGDLNQFCFFFPELTYLQNEDLSILQLDQITSQMTSFSTYDYRILSKALLKSLDSINASKSPKIQLTRHIATVFAKIIDLKGMDISAIGIESDFLFRNLVKIYTEWHIKSVLRTLIRLSDKITFDDLLPLIISDTNLALDCQEQLCDNEMILMILHKLYYLYSSSEINKLTNTQKYKILDTFRSFYFDYHSPDPIYFDSLAVAGLSALLIEISAYDISTVGEDLFNLFGNPEFARVILNLPIEHEIAIFFLYSLNSFLHYIGKSSEIQNFNSSLTIMLMGMDIEGSFMLKSLDYIFRSDLFISITASPGSLTYTEMLECFQKSELSQFWYQIDVLNEILWNIMYMSSDKLFYQRSQCTREDFKNYALFLKSFVATGIMKHDDSIQNGILHYKQKRIYHTCLKSSMKLLHAIHIRNYTLKLFDNDFWTFSHFTLTNDMVSTVVQTIEELQLEFETEARLELFSLNFSSFKIKNKSILSFLYALTYIPFMIPFKQRALVFHGLITACKRNTFIFDKVQGTVNRDSILIDSFTSFGKMAGRNFREPFSVQFINEFGEAEAGIDGGGLTKELLTCIVSEAFIPSAENREKSLGMQFFKEGSYHQLYPNPEFHFMLADFYRKQGKEGLKNSFFQLRKQLMKFIGQIMGKCIYDNVLMDLSFTNFFLRKWVHSYFGKNLIGQKLTSRSNKYLFEDLQEYDVDIYRSLSQILLISSENEMEQLNLTFSITDYYFLSDGTKEYVEIDLIPSGHSVQVNLQNRLQFVFLLTKFKLETQFQTLTDSFLEGLFSVIEPHWLSLFDSHELQTLISGGEQQINIDDLFDNVEFGGFSRQDETVQHLYEILDEFDNDHRAQFLKFVTSCPKQPLLGFKELSPKFGIRNAGRQDLVRLPTASTCVNLLKIPDYKDKETLRRKLLQSIKSGAGFDLS
ncbi:ubiquitin-ubiquitin ligase [Martiniozyma asiatica (nom. inval.)]|nr:ubiquitin-ubiquitin ligase [Martiniozyma asiatica]